MYIRKSKYMLLTINVCSLQEIFASAVYSLQVHKIFNSQLTNYLLYICNIIIDFTVRT